MALCTERAKIHVTDKNRDLAVVGNEATELFAPPSSAFPPRLPNLARHHPCSLPLPQCESKSTAQVDLTTVSNILRYASRSVSLRLYSHQTLPALRSDTALLPDQSQRVALR